MALGKKTGGRVKGSQNKAPAAKAAEIAASGLTPLDYMLKTLRDEKLAHVDRMDAAKAAAPYVHAKLAMIEHDAGDNMMELLAEIIGQRRLKVSELNSGNAA